MLFLSNDGVGLMLAMLSIILALQVGRWTCNQKVVDSSVSRDAAVCQLWASCSHLCVPFTKQYCLVPVNRRSSISQAMHYRL